MSEEIRGLNEEALARIVAAAVKAATQNDPLREKQLQEELAQEQRKLKMMTELGKIEQEAIDRKKNQCSHLRYPMAQGKLGGHAAQKGTPGAEWTTGGQAHSTELATLICTRCSYTWQFKPTPAEYQAIEQAEMMGWAPPDPSRVLVESVA